jgi:hypothetical protein
LTAPDWLRVAKERMWVYRVRKGQRRGTRLGGLRLKRAGKERYRIGGTVPAPGLRSNDGFFVCVPIRDVRAFGRLERDLCGRRRI